MAAEVVPLAPLRTASGPAPITPEQKYWATFSSQIQLPSPQSSPITHISWPSQPPPASVSLSASLDSFAITSGPRIQLFNSRTRQSLRTISRFDAGVSAHSGSIRRDGRVLVAGADNGMIQAFDVSSRSVLKTWKEHKQPVWVTQWHPSDLTGLMSCSDDTTVRLWDLPAESSVRTWRGHTDYVRTGAWLESGNAMCSGSYDQTVRLWDPRIESDKHVMAFKLPGPVESVLPMPGSTTLVAAADNAIAVLDLVAGKPLQLLKNHQKTVTSLSLASQGKRVLSGGLDGHVKVFDTQTWNVVAGFKYPSPVLALSVVGEGREREDKHLVVGMQSGLLSIRTRLSGQAKVQARDKAKEMQALQEGRIEEYDKKQLKRKKGRGWERATRGKDFTGEGADIVIEGNARGKIKNTSQWERLLRRGQYSKALDVVLEPRNPSKTAVLTLLTALRHRSALRTALKGRDEITLQPILKWLNRAITDPRYVRLTTDTALVILDLYATHMGKSPEIDALVKQLHDQVRTCSDVCNNAWMAIGMLDMLTAGG